MHDEQSFGGAHLEKITLKKTLSYYIPFKSPPLISQDLLDSYKMNGI